MDGHVPTSDRSVSRKRKDLKNKPLIGLRMLAVLRMNEGETPPTGHSAQGKTLPVVVTDLNKGGFAAYVAASRPTTRDCLILISKASKSSLNKLLPPELIIESRIAVMPIILCKKTDICLIRQL
jgi:hypothetical protein